MQCHFGNSLLASDLSVGNHCIADPPILSSSPRNGSERAMNADLSLVEQSDSSACSARSLQNVPVRPPIAQATPSFFCTFLRISQKISISERLRAGCSLDTEGVGRKSQEKEGSRFCTEVAEGKPIGRPRFVLSSCLRLRLTNRWPVPQEPYRQDLFLVDEDRIGGSAIPDRRFSGSSRLDRNDESTATLTKACHCNSCIIVAKWAFTAA